MIHAVFDTNIILQAILGEGGPADACLRLVFEGSVVLIVTDAVLKEIEEVVARPRLAAKYPILRSERPGHLLKKIYGSAMRDEHPRAHLTLERDRTDEVFLNLAIANRADYIVTRDRDLLDLCSDSAFSSQFPGLKIVTPVGFLEAVRAL